MTGGRIELANLGGRAQLVMDGRLIDVERRSARRFSHEPMDVIDLWEPFCDWAREQRPDDSCPPIDPARLSAPVPAPSQLFAIGLNYRAHAQETGAALPKEPMVFTKFPSCLAGPCAQVPITSDSIDWEVELCVVVGRGGRRIAAERALEHVAGYCVGQDISDRRRQRADVPPQFSLAKSAAAFGPLGPALVDRGSVPDPSALRLTCDVDGQRMQDGRTADMIFSVPELLAYLSSYCELRPGDLIFTGTPAGVGIGRKPPVFLRPGQRIESEISGLGRLDNRCVEVRGPG
jgi:2-keto-4-pentenoate hydratase/2-oxohepta-3-ene-1,7-dioic acid hydratase in catechol pathway